MGFGTPPDILSINAFRTMFLMEEEKGTGVVFSLAPRFRASLKRLPPPLTPPPLTPPKSKSPALSDFYWQNGYGAFSVSPIHVEALFDYILHQEEHHRHETFQDEFLRLLRKYNLEWDERYVWD